MIILKRIYYTAILLTVDIAALLSDTLQAIWVYGQVDEEPWRFWK